MPVEILDNSGATSIDGGTIKLADLQKMVTDYRQQVTVSGIFNANTVIPKYSFYFTKLQLDDLFATNPGANGIEISLAVQLPGSNVLCHGATIDTSNSIVTVISCATVDSSQLIYESFNNVGNTVLINGYKMDGRGAAGDCCPGNKP